MKIKLILAVLLCGIQLNAEILPLPENESPAEWVKRKMLEERIADFQRNPNSGGSATNIFGTNQASINIELDEMSWQITQELSTNWTGYSFQVTNELGYVITNHVLTVTYQDTTNRFTLKSVPSGIAVWRPSWVTQHATNLAMPGTLWITNVGSLTNYAIPLAGTNSWSW